MSYFNRNTAIASRVLATAAALVILTWSAMDERFRDVEGYVTGQICLSWAAAIALLVWAAIAQTAWHRFAGWLTVALFGQAVSLQLIDAGPRLHYQHYGLSPEFWKPANAWLLLLIASQTMLVLVSIARRGNVIRKAIGSSFGFGRSAAILLLICLVSAPVSRHIPDYLIELPFAAFIQLLNLATLILLVGAIPIGTTVRPALQVERWLGPMDDSTDAVDHRIGRFAVAGAVWVAALAATLNAISYERHPHVQDEVTYLHQARTLASGSLTAPAPPAKAPFDFYLMAFKGDRWYGTPPVGWPAVLSLGVTAGVPSLVNPVLGGLNTFLAALLVAQLYDRRTARLVVLLLCLSPWYVFMAMNYMTHTLSLTCALFATLAVMRSRQTERALWALSGGLAVGYLSLIRPLEGLVVAVLLGLWAIGLGGRRLTIVSIVAFVTGTCAIGSLTLPHNYYLTGSVKTFPIMAYTDTHMGHGSNAMGFGENRGLGWALDPWPGHGPLDAIVNANLNLFSMNVELLGWSIGSFLFIAIMMMCGTWSRNDRLMLAVIVVILGIHVFYWFSGGPDFGARYWFLVIVPCIVLTARGIHLTAERFTEQCQARSESVRRVMLGVLCASALSLVNYFPWRAVDKYHHYLQMRPDIPRIADRYAFGRSLVLIRGEAHPDYASAATYNPIDLRDSNPVYAWDRNEETRAEALSAYPDRTIWVVDGPSRTGRGFEIVAGPLLANQLRGADR